MLKLNCEQATRMMSESQERPLRPAERTVLRMHTWICAGCRNFGGQLGFIRQAMKGFAAQADDDHNAPPGGA
ncbi:MAG: zf-HC2 domain-containing protein [Aquabacterium sp.]|nr:zf-HC2 domain-containing protein [Aquabacterium sp.]